MIWNWTVGIVLIIFGIWLMAKKEIRLGLISVALGILVTLAFGEF